MWKLDQKALRLSEVIRNGGLILGGFIGLVIAVWRSSIAERQRKLAEKGHNIDRLQKAIEMLRNENLYIRITSLNTLRDLFVHDAPENDILFTLNIISIFIRHPPKNIGKSTDNKDANPYKEDMETAIGVITEIYKLPNMKKIIEKHLKEIESLLKERYPGKYLYLIDLSDCKYLNGLETDFTNLSFSDLIKANLTEAILIVANLTGADLTEVCFQQVMGLTPEQTEQAWAWQDKPPKSLKRYTIRLIPCSNPNTWIPERKKQRWKK